MANGMGSLYIGTSGLQSSQNALNTTANNLANVDTKGYVRQQVLFTDKEYNTFQKTTKVNWKQTGLGVTIGDVVHSRDLFLDKYYRNEVGRQSFYESVYETVNEIEDLFQELEGKAFQDTLNDFWVAFQELAKEPDASVKHNLVVQKATLFLTRAQETNDALKSYQVNMNLQISETADRINEIGKNIQKLNLQIQKIEAGGVETAMTLRDERDNALDELATLANITYRENPDGTVKVKLEDVLFVDEVNVYQIALNQDPYTEFMTPYWPHLSNVDEGHYNYVFDFTRDINTANNNDVGKLKALVMSRGDRFGSYSDIEHVSAHEYNTGIAKSTIVNAQAELDQMMHAIVTAINDILCPNKTTSFTAADGTVYNNVKVWDEANAPLGKDGFDEGVKPGHELFTRVGCERYSQVLGNDGNVYYVYNEEDPGDISKRYTLSSINLNQVLVEQESFLPYLTPTGEVDYGMAERLAAVWEQDLLRLNPNDTDRCNFREYYQRMLNELSDRGSVYNTLSTSLANSVQAIGNQRLGVIGVSSDEELTSMIKYQSAYNAASRYINVISEMLEHLVTRLGA